MLPFPWCSQQEQFPTTTSVPPSIITTGARASPLPIPPLQALEPRKANPWGHHHSKALQDMGPAGFSGHTSTALHQEKYSPFPYESQCLKKQQQESQLDHRISLVSTQSQAKPNIMTCRAKSQGSPADNTLLEVNGRAQQLNGENWLFGMPGSWGYWGDGREMVMEPGSSKAPRFCLSRDPES